MEPVDDGKYMTYKREDAILVADGYVTFKETAELPDAVVIRRQDLFASPALATYASMIAIAINLSPDEMTKLRLRKVGDYFQRQSELAADEGYKLPGD